ncbi:transport protein particle 22 kDa subunit [Brettanomyces nanus]|uniref:Trafficking protein particle complex subunit BET3 n=1 Tax=Eeniella nana TaxID=13502 RepID=A0A875S0N0_EENNA|nr:transport protein particle 22 kDa subunit [Brettanomyces nanus]QPG73672.1 transport protein particle 22 kDa subunit [Brettanomyces nanus]
MSRQLKQLGDDIWRNKVEKVNSELFTLTYGSIVAQLCKDFNYNYDEVNNELFQMGYSIGIRLIDEFLQKTQLSRCVNLKDTAEIVSKIGFKIFLNITPTVAHWAADYRSFGLILTENPLADFVELPDDGKASKKLWYSNILCGVLKGCFEMVQLDCDVSFIQDTLKGDDATEIRVKLIKILKDEIPAGEE